MKDDTTGTNYGLKRGLSLIIVLLVAILFTLTNPEEHKHEAVVREAVKEQAEGFWESLQAPLAADAVANMLDHRNFVLFSVTSVSEEGVVTVGVLEQIWIIHPDLRSDAE